MMSSQYAPDCQSSTVIEASTCHSRSQDESQDGKAKEATSSLSPADHSSDTGRACWSFAHYMVIFGSFCGLFASFGWCSGIGLFQDYYQRNQLKAYSPTIIAWINSLGFFLMYFGACLVGPLTIRLGPMPVIVVGSTLHVAGLLGTSFSSRLYQIILLQGILSPLGVSAVFFVNVQILNRWFRGRQSLVTAISACGTSIGGVIFPLMIKYLLPKIGFGWTMRCVVLIIFLLLTITTMCIKSPPANPIPQPQPSSASQNNRRWSTILRDRNLLLTISGISFLCSTYFLVSGFVVPVARLRGIVGRIVPGLMADRIGRFNTMALFGVLSTAFIFGLWLPGTGVSTSIAFSVIYGFSSGCAVSLGPSMIFKISHPQHIIPNLTVLYCVQSIAALFINPIGGALLSVGHGQNPHYLQLLAGFNCAVGTILTILARASQTGLVVRKVA
ncbi:major facilitator superfamily domain-containing protein [Aspergillus caelatus]|uniref:Major facilitator superfamily domain-containing protein n=1 Tax=Aspergillus caelatus TaxID=61420 RepID=A0A5N6ZKZ2_9EURO|nr:major facilitator superfamily domain-containing protein [Aspergillus caelatus]KAE8358145.1 major facilitator superfamily domain-containing protein [Aspergillus caelatus]